MDSCHVMQGGSGSRTAMAAVARRLPFGLSEVVPPNVVGYLLISGCTFCLDLILLTIFHGALGMIPAGRGDAVLRHRRPW